MGATGGAKAHAIIHLPDRARARFDSTCSILSDLSNPVARVSNCTRSIARVHTSSLLRSGRCCWIKGHLPIRACTGGQMKPNCGVLQRAFLLTARWRKRKKERGGWGVSLCHNESAP